MRNLQHLWLQHNRLQTLPPSIGLLSNSLIEILLDGNPFIGPIDEYITPLLLLSEHLPSGYKVNRLTREQLNAKNGQRKSSSVDARASMKNKHWHRARLTLARSRTKSLAMAAPFFHIHHGVSPATSATASPSHTRSSSINDTINEEEPEYINELREDKTAKKGIFHRMRKGSFTGNKPDELYSKSPQLMAQRLSGVNVTGDEPLDNHESDSVAQEAQSKLRRSWRSLRKPISFGSDLNMAAQSPTRSPLGSPYRFEDARQAASSNNFYFPPLPTSVMSSVDETSDTNHTQILRDSGYGVDNTANEETMSNMVFSDEERAALSTTDDGNADFDGLNGFVVSEEVAALAAATKAAFIRRGRNASNGSIRQRASTPALRDAYASGLSGTVSNAGTFARHSSHHRSPSYSRTLTSPRSLMNMSHYPGTATSANASIYDQNSRPSTPLSPAMSIMSIEAGMAQMSLDATNSLSPDEQLQAHAESTMASFEASMTHAYTESAAFEAYSIERRTAMKRLLFYLRDIWDLGVGLQMLKEGDVHVRMLESQPHVPLPEELIGNRPISLDVNGCK
ncbi:hypothetical protein BDF19DRAFT_479176 [Syncephalis fuscata]|nr:hypothetical protein BDF19DRAFT_479176 [Syncephalis fuscata]